MASEGWIPRILARVHPRTRTPFFATVFVFLIMVVFTTLFDIGKLANLTSFAILLLFSFVAAALIRIKMRDGNDYD